MQEVNVTLKVASFFTTFFTKVSHFGFVTFEEKHNVPYEEYVMIHLNSPCVLSLCVG